MRVRISSINSDRLAYDRERQARFIQQCGEHFASVSTAVDGGYRDIGDWRADNDLYSGLSAKLNESGLERAGLDMKRGLAFQFVQPICSIHGRRSLEEDGQHAA
jgi:hypothetical protein